MVLFAQVESFFSLNFNTLIAALALIAAAVNGVLIAWAQKRKIDREDKDADNDRMIRSRDIQVQSLEEEINRLKIDNKEFQTEIKLLRKEIRAWERRVAQLEVAATESPLPSWEVGTDKRYVSVNKAYVAEILVPLDKDITDIIGRSHEEFWGGVMGNPNLASILASLDEKALKMDNKTAVADGVVFANGLGEWVVVKRQRMMGGRVFGMYGTAFPAKNKVSFDSSIHKK